MAVDYINALNAGSGLNTTEIIDALVEADRAPRASQITKAQDQLSVSISSFGQIKQELSNFRDGLGLTDQVTGLAVTEAGTAAIITLKDKAIARDFSHQLAVSNLAAGQTLVFDGFASSTDSLGAGSLDFAFGSWTGASFTANSAIEGGTVELADGADTLAELRDSINAAGLPVSASILKKGDSNYALVLQAEEGFEQAMQITASENVAGSGLAAIAYDGSDPSIETIAGQDAAFELDGISLTRSSNKLADVIPGVELQLVKTTDSAQTISAGWQSDTALAAARIIVAEMNSLSSALASASRRASNSEDSGPLAGDPLVASLRNSLRRMTTQPLAGFEDNPVYLSNFGIRTERDGSLTLDETVFKQAYEASPDSFAAIVNSRVTSNRESVAASLLTDNWTAGVYDVSFDADGEASIGEDDFSRSGSSYLMSSGPASGLRLEVTGSGADTRIYIGKSLFEQLDEFAAALLVSGNQIDDKIDAFNASLDDYATKITELDRQMDSLRARYVKKFTAMESAVAAFKDTEKALDSMMEAWKAALNN